MMGEHVIDLFGFVNMEDWQGIVLFRELLTT
ncbi:hypothetical protein IIU_06085 [Bacillus cereus VD133]|uniref:Uncharacterized protein n=1 Tax=Bacillus cereus VD133 TaxID=1053233 RepID=A0A9W5PL31_BACCE|nr:hypothetical protein IIU_06085 [Bacillus cereus VD133]